MPTAHPRILLIYRDAERVPAYREAAVAAALEPYTVEAGTAFSWEGIRGLMLMGGVDVDPSLYGEQPHEETNQPDRELDRVEREAIDTALYREMPILAICRGMQLLNVHHGGSLFQHLTPVERHRTVKDQDRSIPIHEAHVGAGSLLEQVMGSTAPLPVNSRHHQAVDRIGQGLQVCATAPDGVIEAVELPGRQFVLGVQWHPEDQIWRNPEQLKLFESFRRAIEA